MEELLVVMQVEAIEIDTLAPIDLFDSQNHPTLDLQCLAGAGRRTNCDTTSRCAIGYLLEVCWFDDELAAGPCLAANSFNAVRIRVRGPAQCRGHGLIQKLELLLVQHKLKIFALTGISSFKIDQHRLGDKRGHAPAAPWISWGPAAALRLPPIRGKLYVPGVQPFGACMVVLLIDAKFAGVTANNGTSIDFWLGCLPLISSSAICAASLPIRTGCWATT